MVERWTRVRAPWRPSVALASVLLGLSSTASRAEEPVDDVTWRSPWTVSVSVGAEPLVWWRAATEPGYTVLAWGGAVDVALPVTVGRSPDDRRSFAIGPQLQAQRFRGVGTIWRAGDIGHGAVFQTAIGAIADVRFRVRGPPTPGGKAGFEHGFRMGVAYGVGFAGYEASLSAEAWATWSPAPRASPTRSSPIDTRRRRTAVLVGPYLRTWVRQLGVPSGWGGAAEVGLRLDVRREHAVPAPPG